MRVLNLHLYPRPEPIGQRGLTALGHFDLELDRGIVARRLCVMQEAGGTRLVWSKRHAGKPTVELDDGGAATVLSLVDLAIRDGRVA